MRGKKLFGLMACLASIILVTIAFQFFSLKHSNLGKHNYIAYNNLAMPDYTSEKTTSFALVPTAMFDMALGSAALAAEYAAGTLTIFLRSAPTAEEKIISESRFTNNITLNNLD